MVIVLQMPHSKPELHLHKHHLIKTRENNYSKCGSSEQNSVNNKMGIQNDKTWWTCMTKVSQNIIDHCKQIPPQKSQATVKFKGRGKACFFSRGTPHTPKYLYSEDIKITFSLHAFISDCFCIKQWYSDGTGLNILEHSVTIFTLEQKVTQRGADTVPYYAWDKNRLSYAVKQLLPFTCEWMRGGGFLNNKANNELAVDLDNIPFNPQWLRGRNRCL